MQFLLEKKQNFALSQIKIYLKLSLYKLKLHNVLNFMNKNRFKNNVDKEHFNSSLSLQRLKLYAQKEIEKKFYT